MTLAHDMPQALVLPDSERWDEARSSWNLTADLQPAAVWEARTVQEVQAGVAWARERGLRVAVTSTGHLAPRLPDLDGALLLRPMLHDGEIEVDPVARTARVKAGALWGQVVEAVAPHGLAAMHGSSPTVGVIGYLLGGGLSFYGRALGLAANHIRAFEVVTPDGAWRRVDAECEPELFVALRGGGGGFAIVCAVEIELLAIAEVTGGALFFAGEDAGRVLGEWTRWTRDAPSEVTTTFRVLQLPDIPEVPGALRGAPTVCVDGVSLRPEPLNDMGARLRRCASPILGGYQLIPSAMVIRIHNDPEDPMPGIGDGILLDELDENAVEAFAEVTGPGSPLISAELRQLGGALAESPATAGARGSLEGHYALYGCGVPDAPASQDELVDFLSGYLETMRPWATGTRFSSFAEGWGSLATCLPDDALTRLVHLRQALDPDGLLIAPQLPTMP